MNTATWREFAITDLFDLRKGQRLTKQNMTEGKTPFVSASAFNNGITRYIGQKPNHDAGTISVCYNGSVGQSFYQPAPYWASDDIIVLYPKFELGPELGLAFATIIRTMAQERYGYTHKWNLARMEKDSLLLPEKDGKPDFEWLTRYVAAMVCDIREIVVASSPESVPVNTLLWQDFAVGGPTGLFDVSGSKTTNKRALEASGEGDYPYVTTKATDNGIAGYFNIFTEQGNCLTVDSAVLGTCFYQANCFSASDHVEVLRPRYANFRREHGLFIKSCLDVATQGVYHYGHKCNQQRIKETVIKLPAIVNPDGTVTPDWEFMSRYIAELEAAVATLLPTAS